LTFCRRDRVLGEWLRRELEAWRIESDLVGRFTPAGPVPATLRPVCCHREPVGAGEALPDVVVAALQRAQFLLVLCSPAAAESRFIDAQVRCFQAMGRCARVIPVVVAGDPGSSIRACLPPALRVAHAPGASAARERPIDLRRRRDGCEGGKRRIMAALLGLPPHEIERRAERGRQRRLGLRLAAAAALIALTFAVEAGVDWARSRLYRDDALHAASLSHASAVVASAAGAARRLGLPQDVAVTALRGAEAGLDALAAVGRDTAHLRLRRAHLRMELARGYDALGAGNTARMRASEAEREIVRLAAEVPDNALWRHALARSFAALGDLLHVQGRIAPALASYRESIALTERLAAGDPGRAPDLAARYLRLGDLDLAVGAHDDALAHFHESLAIHERLAGADLREARRQILRVRLRIGYALREKGELDDALASFAAARALAERLVRAGDVEGGRALAAAHVEIGDVLAVQNEPAAALASYRASRAVALRHAEASAADWQEPLRMAHQRIGLMLEAQGDLRAALTEHRTALALAARLARAGEGEGKLAMAHGHVGDALRGLGNLEGALAAYREKRGIVARLAGAGDAGWQHELGTTHARIGFVHEVRGDFAAAQREYEALFAIGRHFAAAEPGNPRWQRDLAVSHGRLAAVYHRRGKAKAALAELRRGRDIMAALVAAAPEFAPWSTDLAGFEAQIAAVEGRAVGPSAPVACAAPCPPAVAPTSFALSPDLRDRVAARPPAARTRLSN
jgi:tetratricopeptide (TPR) repeat protein